MQCSPEVNISMTAFLWIELSANKMCWKNMVNTYWIASKLSRFASNTAQGMLLLKRRLWRQSRSHAYMCRTLLKTIVWSTRVCTVRNYMCNNATSWGPLTRGDGRCIVFVRYVTSAWSGNVILTKGPRLSSVSPYVGTIYQNAMTSGPKVSHNQAMPAVDKSLVI
jgi:hypothetical protein